MSCTNCFYRLLDCSRPLEFFRRCWCSRSRRRNKIVLMLMGLDNAGKSCTAMVLAGEPVESVIQTVGFDSINLQYEGFSIVIYDLGGSEQIRGIWPRYFVDVHGVMFVVDSSDHLRIDESRRVLEEVLVHEKLAGKPLLLLANKQNKEGALDELDIVDRLNLESLVNQLRCPTLVETCSAAGHPAGRRPYFDPSITNGYRWLLRRIISEYDTLNSRVEQDCAEQRAAIEAARQEWLSRQDTNTQADSLSECGSDPFKPIASLLVKEQNGHVVGAGDFETHPELAGKSNGHIPGSVDGDRRDGPAGKSNGHLVQVEPVSPTMSEDSPDSSSHAVHDVGSSSPPLHPLAPAEPHILIISEPQPLDVVTAVRDKFEWKMQKQKKSKLLSRRSNRTAPASADMLRALPPLKTHSSCHWARPDTAKSLPSEGWGLSLSLEEVNPPEVESLKLEVVQTPRTLIISESDDDDVVCSSTRS